MGSKGTATTTRGREGSSSRFRSVPGLLLIGLVVAVGVIAVLLATLPGDDAETEPDSTEVESPAERDIDVPVDRGVPGEDESDDDATP